MPAFKYEETTPQDANTRRTGNGALIEFGPDGKILLYGELAQRIMDSCRSKGPRTEGQKEIYSATIEFESSHNPVQINDRC